MSALAKAIHTLSIPNSVLIPKIRQIINEGHTVTFTVRGFSMRPFLENQRDKVLLRPYRSEEIRVGQVVLAEVGKQVYALHRIIACDGKSITMRGDGNIYGTETCTLADVIGIAEAFYRKGRSRPDLISGYKWRIYSALWPSMPLLRRIILAIYRRIV